MLKNENVQFHATGTKCQNSDVEARKRDKSGNEAF